MEIVILGSGNVATHLAKALRANNITISQIYSRSFESAQNLANIIGSDFTNSVSKISRKADIYFYAITDDALLSIIESINIPNAIHVHTAGSVEMEIFKNHVNHYGVFYPLQTFSRTKELDFKDIPILIEASNIDTENQLFKIANAVSKHCLKANSTQRKQIHLAAVFVCNFTNYMYSVGAELAENSSLSFDILKPLIAETANKINFLAPKDAQTGPATRNDKKVINEHLKMLETEPELQQLYQEISSQIYIMKK